MASAVPAIFAADSSGKNQGAILNQDTSYNSTANPASRNSVIVLFTTGEGQTSPPGVDGLLAADVLPKPNQQVTAQIGGIPAEVIYAGAAPGLTAGVMQVNLRVPENAPSGNVPVVVSVGVTTSQQDITVAIN